MLKSILFFSILFFSIQSYAFHGKVISVSDGDTITVLTNDNKQYKIRLVHIDAPESKQAFGNQAKNALSNLIYSKQVYIQRSGVDQYNRILGTVYLGQNNVNKQMVYSGYAWAYRNRSTDPSYIQLERSAKANQRGLWQDKNPIEPKQWRKLQKAQR